MAVGSVVKYINRSGMGVEWRFIADAIFDEGINVLWQFYDRGASDHGNILAGWDKVFGFALSAYNMEDEDVKKLCRHRHNCTAHNGNGRFDIGNQITCDFPIIILERLRRNRDYFNNNYLGVSDLVYDNLEFSFIQSTASALKVLGNRISVKLAISELRDFLNGVLSDCDSTRIECLQFHNCLT